MFNKDTKYLGKFVEVREGVKGVVQKWELFTPDAEHNAKMDVIAERAEASKVDENTPLGKLEESISVK